MPFTEYHWKSFDGIDLYAVMWSSTSQPDAVVAFIHGHGDHCRRYDEWFPLLTARNISVLAFDYRGHGRSEGKRGVIRHYDDLLKDVALLHQKANEFFPGIPVVLYGHSLGATLVLSYLLRSSSKPRLAIATSPWLRLIKPPGKFLSSIIRIGNIVFPFLTVKTGLHARDFSVAEGFAEKRKRDELVHNRMSPRFFSEVEKEVNWIFVHFTDIKTPLLFMQGSDDLIMDCRVTRRLAESLPSRVSYREWKFSGHQLHNSERSDEVMDFITDWIKKGI